MNGDRRAILQMLADGKITADEAERLLAALDRTEAPAPSAAADAPAGAKRMPKYLRVAVDTDEDGDPTKVNIRVPMALLRAGVRLSSVIPPVARDQLNAELAKSGVSFDLNALKPENLEEMIAQLEDLTVDVDKEGTKVRIYCE
jgi:hypothetical protein